MGEAISPLQQNGWTIKAVPGAGKSSLGAGSGCFISRWVEEAVLQNADLAEKAAKANPKISRPANGASAHVDSED